MDIRNFFAKKPAKAPAAAPPPATQKPKPPAAAPKVSPEAAAPPQLLRLGAGLGGVELSQDGALATSEYSFLLGNDINFRLSTEGSGHTNALTQRFHARVDRTFFAKGSALR